MPTAVNDDDIGEKAASWPDYSGALIALEIARFLGTITPSYLRLLLCHGTGRQKGTGMHPPHPTRSQHTRSVYSRPEQNPSGQGVRATRSRPERATMTRALPHRGPAPLGPNRAGDDSCVSGMVDDDLSEEEQTIVRVAGKPRLAVEPQPEPRSARTSEPTQWYARLKLRQDYIAKLWARNLTTHDVMVWWGDRRCWAPLLTIPELRRAITSVASQSKQMAASASPDSEQPTQPTNKPVSRRTSAGAIRETKAIPAVRVRSSTEIRSGPEPATEPLRPDPVRVEDSAAELAPEMHVALSRPARTRSSSPPPRIAVPRASNLPARFTSSIPPAVVAASSAALPRAPRVPRVDMESAAAARPATVPHTSAWDSPFVSNMERALWLVAGIAIMIAATALLQTARHIGEPAENALKQPGLALGPIAAPTSAPPASPVGVTAPAAGCPAPVGSSAAACAPGSLAATTHAAPASSSGGAPMPSMPRAGDIYSADDLPVLGSTTAQAEAETTGARTARATSNARAEKVILKPSGTSSPATGSAFDKNAARMALNSAALRARQCVDGKASGSVVVTFAPSGLVQSAALASINGESVREACVLRAFRMAQITPYSGSPVTVRKSFRLR